MNLLDSLKKYVLVINPTLEKVVTVITILIIGIIIGKFLGLILKSILKWFKVEYKIYSGLGSLLSIIIYIISVIIVLDYLNILNITILLLGSIILLFLIVNLLIVIKDEIFNLLAKGSAMKNITLTNKKLNVSFKSFRVKVNKEDETWFFPYSLIRKKYLKL